MNFPLRSAAPHRLRRSIGRPGRRNPRSRALSGPDAETEIQQAVFDAECSTARALHLSFANAVVSRADSVIAPLPSAIRRASRRCRHLPPHSLPLAGGRRNKSKVCFFRLVEGRAGDKLQRIAAIADGFDQWTVVGRGEHRNLLPGQPSRCAPPTRIGDSALPRSMAS